MSYTSHSSLNASQEHGEIQNVIHSHSAPRNLTGLKTRLFRFRRPGHRLQPHHRSTLCGTSLTMPIKRFYLAVRHFRSFSLIFTLSHTSLETPRATLVSGLKILSVYAPWSPRVIRVAPCNPTRLKRVSPLLALMGVLRQCGFVL